MKPIIYTVSVDNPLYEDFAITQAKHKFIMSSSQLWLDWTNFMPDAEYAERCRAFYKRIVVLSTEPTVSVVDGWYKVTSVLVKMQYIGGDIH